MKAADAKRRAALLKRIGVSGVGKPKRTPGHPKKSHVVVANCDGKLKVIRFGEQGAKTAGKAKKGESDKMRKKRKSFNKEFNLSQVDRKHRENYESKTERFILSSSRLSKNLHMLCTSNLNFLNFSYFKKQAFVNNITLIRDECRLILEDLEEKTKKPLPRKANVTSARLKPQRKKSFISRLFSKNESYKVISDIKKLAVKDTAICVSILSDKNRDRKKELEFITLYNLTKINLLKKELSSIIERLDKVIKIVSKHITNYKEKSNQS